MFRFLFGLIFGVAAGYGLASLIAQQQSDDEPAKPPLMQPRET